MTTPLNSPIATSSIFSIFMCWAVFANTYIMTSNNITSLLPRNHLDFCYMIFVNVCAIFSLRKAVKNSSLVRDVVDLSLYELIFFMVFIDSYFFNHPFCKFLIESSLYSVILRWLSIMTIIRFLWIGGTNGWTQIAISPPIGIMGFISKEKTTYSRVHCLLFYLAMTAGLWVVINVSFPSFPWPVIFRTVIGCIGFFIIAFFGNDIIEKLASTVLAKNTAEQKNKEMNEAIQESTKIINSLKVSLISAATQQEINNRDEAFAVFNQTISKRQREVLNALDSINPDLGTHLIDLIFDTAQDHQKQSKPTKLMLISSNLSVVAPPQNSGSTIEAKL